MYVIGKCAPRKALRYFCARNCWTLLSHDTICEWFDYIRNTELSISAIMAGLAENGPHESRCTSRNATPDENLLSSPSLPALGNQVTSKPKKRPTVTPRTFTRFFTPRSSLGRGKKISASRQALRDITGTGSNRKASHRQLAAGKHVPQVFEDEDVGFSDILGSRKRRIPASPNSTPDRSSPLKRKCGHLGGDSEHENYHKDKTDHEQEVLDSEGAEDGASFWKLADLVKPVTRARLGGPVGRVLRRELNISSNFRCTRAITYCNTSESGYPGTQFCPLLRRSGWQSETANFLSEPEDTYLCTNVATTPMERTIPFCTASCNSKLFLMPGVSHEATLIHHPSSKFSCCHWRRRRGDPTARVCK